MLYLWTSLRTAAASPTTPEQKASSTDLPVDCIRSHEVEGWTRSLQRNKTTGNNPSAPPTETRVCK